MIHFTRERKPRQILSAMMEMSLEERGQNADRADLIREAYCWLDDTIKGWDSGVAPSDQFREALTVADFPHYFGRVLSVGIMARYESRRGQWPSYTAKDTVPDYRVAERYQFAEFDRPVLRREKQETPAGFIYEFTPRQLRVDDYAKQIDFSSRILVNDDLGAFNNIGQKMADSAARFTDWYVSGLYDNALSQAALIALGVNYAGTGRLTTNNLMIAYNAFVQRLDARGNPITIVPKYIVGPPVLRLAANQILESEKVAELATNGNNPLRGLGLQFVEDPYMATAAPNVPWYLFADPGDAQAVVVVRLQSRPQEFRLYMAAPDKVPITPTGTMGTARWEDGSFLSGDIEIEVELTIGARVDDPAVLVGIFDANGIYYSSGTTA